MLDIFNGRLDLLNNGVRKSVVYPKDDLAPENYKPYPTGVPEFRMYTDKNNVTSMQVRYVDKKVGYIGLWMDINKVKGESNGD